MPNGRSQPMNLLALEARLLERTLQASIAGIRQTLPPEEAQAAIERILDWEKQLPMGTGLRLVAGKYVSSEESVCTSQQAAKSDQQIS